jgi:nucleotide-binding universal stress UspA family protein
MFTHLLVPLDGSKMAESVLPAVAYLARTLNARVTLVHVVEHKPPSEVHGEHHIGNPEEAGFYLAGVSHRPVLSGISVKHHVHTSAVEDVARSIYEHVGELGTDLVVMCSHGRSGLRDIVVGNIAQQVIREGITPVLLIQPPEDDGELQFVCHRFLVPLDEHPEHERSLTVVKSLARACGASIHLLEVVPTYGTLSGPWTTTSRLLPGTTSRMLDMSLTEAQEYLDQHRLELESGGLTVTVDIYRGDPANMIAQAAKELEMDLIVLGTHGKAGTEAFWAGSVASKVCRSCRIPMLLIPVVTKGNAKA